MQSASTGVWYISVVLRKRSIHPFQSRRYSKRMSRDRDEGKLAGLHSRLILLLIAAKIPVHHVVSDAISC